MKKFTTTSCPCSSYAVIGSDQKVSCERDNFGNLEYVAPIVLQNHLINDLKPEIGDKWSCGNGIKCGGVGFSWNTLHIVRVVEINDDKVASSRVSSKSSTSNCYIPITSFTDYNKNKKTAWEEILEVYETDKTVSATVPSYAAEGIGNITVNAFDGTIVKTVDGLPIFNNKNAASLYKTLVLGGYDEVSVIDNGLDKAYAPGKYFGDEGLITGITVNGRDIFTKQVARGFNTKAVGYASEKNKLTIPSVGGTIDIQVLGEKNSGVSLKLKDSTDCNMFNTNKDNQVVGKNLTIKQTIPPLGPGKTQEVYTIKITPSAGTRYYLPPMQDANPNAIIGTGMFEVKVWQFKDPTITFDAAPSTVVNSSTVSSPITITGKANSFNEKQITHVTTISNQGEGTNIFYNIKDRLSLADLITDNSAIKKMVINTPRTPECLNSIQVVDNLTTNKGTVEPGMKIRGSYTVVKEITKSTPLYVEDDCDGCDKELEILTDEFEFENVNDLIVGMSALWIGENGVTEESNIKSINGGTKVSLEDKFIIDRNTEVTFTYRSSGLVTEVEGDIVRFEECVWFPRNQEVTFTQGRGVGVKGTVIVGKSGTNVMVITTTIDSIKLNQKDVRLELDVDRFVSIVPNVKEIKIAVTKDNPKGVDLVSEDRDFNSRDKTYTIVNQPRNGELTQLSATYYTYTPFEGFKGLDKFQYRASTGEGGNVVQSEIKSVLIKVR